MNEISIESAMEMIASPRPVVREQGLKMLAQLSRSKKRFQEVAPVIELVSGPRAEFVGGKMVPIKLSEKEAAQRTSLENAIRGLDARVRQNIESVFRQAHSRIDAQKRRQST